MCARRCQLPLQPSTSFPPPGTRMMPPRVRQEARSACRGWSAIPTQQDALVPHLRCRLRSPLLSAADGYPRRFLRGTACAQGYSFPSVTSGLGASLDALRSDTMSGCAHGIAGWRGACGHQVRAAWGAETSRDTPTWSAGTTCATMLTRCLTPKLIRAQLERLTKP